VLLGEAPEADSNHDGYVTSTELEAYLKGWVPKYIANQTPVSGRINDSVLNQGEFIFKIPSLVDSAPKALTGPTRNVSGFRPLFIGGIEASSALRAYELEALLTTASNLCTYSCETTAKVYNLSVRVPNALPTSAVLDEVDLRCASGDCNSFKLLTGPEIRQDRLSAGASPQMEAKAQAVCGAPDDQFGFRVLSAHGPHVARSRCIVVRTQDRLSKCFQSSPCRNGSNSSKPSLPKLCAIFWATISPMIFVAESPPSL
jgi:hypothetical protein